MKILWSDTAKFQLKEIYDYYKEVAGVKMSKSIKEKLIKKPGKLLKYPEMGQVEDNPMVKGKIFRYLVEGHHKLVYKVLICWNEKVPGADKFGFPPPP